MTGGVVFVAELLGDFEAGVAVFLQETEKVLSLNKVHLAGIDGLRGEFVRFAANCGA